MFSAVVVLWLMNVNLIGWLGAWVAPDFAWLVGFGIAAVLAVAFGIGWNILSSQPALKKMPTLGAGLVYGAIVALIMILLVPIFLSAIGDNPKMVYDQYGIGITSFLGVHATPPLPDLGFDLPLASVFEDFDWAGKSDFGGRFPTFGLAFLVFGLVISFFKKGK